MHGHWLSLLALTTAWKKAFVSSTVSRPNNSARRTPRSRVILYPMALKGARKDPVSVSVPQKSHARAPRPAPDFEKSLDSLWTADAGSSSGRLVRAD
jgi:hypothetical protein